MSAKERVLRAVRAMPVDSTVRQIADRIAILATLEGNEKGVNASQKPESETARVRRIHRVVEEMLAARDRNGLKLSKRSVRKLIEQGRRY